MSDFTPFPTEAGRVISNLETAYDQWLDARQQLARLPAASVHVLVKVSGIEYLGVKL